MNPWTWLENHPNAALVAVIGGSIALLFFAGWLIHWYVVAARYWLDWLPSRPRRPALGTAWSMTSWHIEPEPDDEWPPTGVPVEERTCCNHPGTGICMCDCHDWDEPYTDADADRLIADLTTDLPGPDSLPAPWAGEHHERAFTPALVESLTDDPDLLQWDIDCQVARIREIRGELAALRELYAA